MTIISIFTSQVFYIVLAPVVTTLYAVWYAGYSNLNRTRMLTLSLVCCVGAFWGGDLYLLFQSEQFDVSNEPWQLIEFLPGEKGVFGAFTGAAIFGYIFTRILKINFFTYADAAVPAVALGYFIARIACYINGDDFGVLTNVPWAVSFDKGSVAFYTHLERGWINVNSSQSLTVHPTQSYSSLVGLLCFLFFSKYKSGWHGEKLALALFIYGVSRFVIQFYRDDHYITSALLDRSQWFCLAFVVVSFGLWLNNSLRMNDNAIQPSNNIKLYS